MDKTPKGLRDRADRYRLMATQTTDQMAIEALQELAVSYDALADERESSPISASPE